MNKFKLKIIKFLVGKEQVAINVDIKTISENIFNCKFVNSYIEIELNNVSACNIMNNDFSEESKLYIYNNKNSMEIG